MENNLRKTENKMERQVKIICGKVKLIRDWYPIESIIKQEKMETNMLDGMVLKAEITRNKLAYSFIF